MSEGTTLRASPRPAIQSNVRIRNRAFQLKSVFDQDADSNLVDALRAAVVEDLHALSAKFPQCWQSHRR
jgi:hypothetical protein